MAERITREQAHDILMKYMKGERYIQHSYAVEAIMKGLAKRLAPDEVEYWGIAGLLHDIGGIYPNDQLHRISIGKSYGRVSNKNFIENLAREYHLDLSDKQGLKYPANFDVVHQILTVNL